MKRRLVIQGSIGIDGASEPEMTFTQRIEWPEDKTMEEVFEEFAHRMCRELHAPKLVWKSV